MGLPRREFLAGAAAAVPLVSRLARAQTYPTHPVTIVVPYPPNGTSDAIPRIMGIR
jgi:tripartite-type tricarboxylate transporter receptor subunit TctC